MIITQEVTVLFSRKRGHANGWMTIKLDLEKADNKLNWDFICNTLSLFHYPHPKRINLIRSCITFVEHSMIFNGCLSDFFSPKRGIRQEDPLSSYLFILCIKLLPFLINNKVNNKRWIAVNFKDVKISHLLYADDVLLFAKVNKKSVKSIDSTLKTFMSLLGLNINYSKSSIWFSPNTPDSKKLFASNVLGIKEPQRPCVYLGIPLGIFRKKRDFEYDIDKIKNRISWNGKYLSQLAKMVLICSVCSAILSFFMKCLPFPKGTCSNIDKCLRNFFWDSMDGKKKLHFINWDTIRTPIDEGGLGFSSLLTVSKPS